MQKDKAEEGTRKPKGYKKKQQKRIAIGTRR